MNGKKILLCVTGGIAAFKAAGLTSKLVQAGAEVRVLMSEGATKFITPLTFQALSRHHVYTDTFDEKEPEIVSHIEFAAWADAVIIAPATANIIGKLANGIADDMISSTLLATRVPVFVAAAMNVHMYEHPVVQKNMESLRALGYQFVEPNEGFLACGYVAKGRMEEPENIVAVVSEYFAEEKLLAGQKIVITAGPTREKIDSVRFFTNRSTGKMGYALAETATKLGADVTLISGPTNLAVPAGVPTIQVETAQEMYDAVMKHFADADVVIKTAAVADYRPKIVYDNKMKKSDGDLSIELERTMDILKELGERKEQQILIGFAAETDHVEAYATKKLIEKNADMIVANNISAQGAGFGVDTNIVTMYKRDGGSISLPKLTKHEVASCILKELAKMLPEEKR